MKYIAGGVGERLEAGGTLVWLVGVGGTWDALPDPSFRAPSTVQPHQTTERTGYTWQLQRHSTLAAIVHSDTVKEVPVE